MTKIRTIEEICAGKSVRIFGARADRDTVSFVESFRNCGSKACVRCADKTKRPHGPYWTLNYVDDRGRPRSLYVGRKLPEFAESHLKVSFADVLAFYKENDDQKESLKHNQEEIRRIKKEMDSLYEELRILRRQSRRTTGGSSAEPFFRKLVLKYHPDRNSHRMFEAEDVMKDINQLYQKLVKS